MYYGRMIMKSLLKFIALLMLLATLCIFFLQTAKWIAFAIALLAFWNDFR